jgi:hypothetical protein
MTAARPGRTGATVLTITIVLASMLAVGVFAYHFLWRGSSKTLFSVQENRELINLARSAIAEAYFRVQVDLDGSKSSWFDWCTLAIANPRTFVPQRTRDNATSVMSASQTVKYTTSDVTLERVVRLSPASMGTDQGIIDLKVTVTVDRSSPKHHATLTMVERRNFRLAANIGPFAAGGRHVVISPTPAMTSILE